MQKRINSVKDKVIDVHELLKINLATYEGRRLLLNYVHQHPFTWFAIGGTICFVFEIIFTVFLTEAFNVWHMLSYGISLIIGLIFLYFFYAHFTFKRFDKAHRRITKFFGLMTTSYFINWMIVYLLTYLKFHYGAAIILATSALSFFNYYLNMHWVFRKYEVYE